MVRIFISSQDISAGTIVISDNKKLHYLKDVLRLKKGEELTAVDENETAYCAVAEKITARGIILRIKKERPKCMKQSRLRLTIACAIPKKTRMDDIVDKLTQLGVDCIIPMFTERVIVKLDGSAAEARFARWQKVAQSASQQSQRISQPVVEKIKKIEEVIENSNSFDLKLIPALIGERRVLKEILDRGGYKNILVLIGPEGDFTPEELALAMRKGFIPVTMGEQVLRVETAAVAAASFIRLYENH
ncbi:MAG: RsmE family RNA methyltransferase [Candidatus Omnitrophica bacterium]|nr:RsmE family RNA methyltransferase [Candidatus Omnitrophota bacterium]